MWWLTFALVCIVAALITVLPGSALLVALGLKPEEALLGSGPVSITLICLLGIILHPLGLVGLRPLSIALVITTLVFSLVGVFRRQTHTAKHALDQHFVSLKEVFFVLLVSFIVVGIIFVYNLDGPESYIQFADNMTHLAFIRSMLDGGSASTIALSYTGDLAAQEMAFTGSSYYPAAFHIVAALAAWPFQVSAAMAENAMTFVSCAVIYPLGLAGMTQLLFPDSAHARVLGGVCAYAGVAFPLRLITVHGPYPQLLGFACLPAFLWLLMLSHKKSGEHGLWLPALVGSLLALLGAVFSHPNTAFSALLFVLPYVLFEFIPNFCATQADKSSRVRLQLLLSLASVALFVLIWFVGLNLSFMQSIINFTWYFLYEPLGTLKLILSFATGIGIPQYALALVVLVGFIRALGYKNMRWVAGAYFLICVVYFVGMSFDYELKRIAIGFWYTDPERIIAMIALAAVPLALFGLDALAELLGRLVNTKVALGIVTALFVLTNYYPYLPQIPTPVPTAYGNSIYQLYHDMQIADWQNYSNYEQDFVKAVKEQVGEDELILNLPYDGSSFAGSKDELKIYYLAQGGGSSESEASKIIRTDLNEIATNPRVLEAVETTGARYVLLLDASNFFLEEHDDGDRMIGGFVSYKVDDWEGFEINDTTPGFSIVLEEGNMRLYEIDEAA